MADLVLAHVYVAHMAGSILLQLVELSMKRQLERKRLGEKAKSVIRYPPRPPSLFSSLSLQSFLVL